MWTNFNSSDDFWKAYLRDHRGSVNRALHVFGLIGAVVALIIAAFTEDSEPIIAALGFIFIPGWIGHLLIDRKWPTTFGHPIDSLVSDLRMAFCWCMGSLEREFERGLSRTGAESVGMYELPELAARRMSAHGRERS